MLTSELVAVIQQDSPDTETPTILMYLNEIQRVMMSKPITSSRIIDPLTGDDPTIVFDSDVRLYDLDTLSDFPEDALFIHSVYSNDVMYPEDVKTQEATSATPARIITKQHFSGTFFVRAYKKPKHILSVGIQLEIPERYHFDIVLNAVQGYIERSEYGESRKYDTFLKKDLHRFWSEQSIRESIDNNMRTPYE